MLKDLLCFALGNIYQRKLRSILTGLGVVISVAAIVALLSISSSLQIAIEKQFAKMGANRIFIMVPGGEPGSRSGLTTHDADILERMPELEYVTPYLVIPSATVKFGTEEKPARIVGWTYDNIEKRVADYDFTFQAGYFFRKGQANSVVIGSNLAKADEIFSRSIRLRNQLTINGEKFAIVGVMNSMGNREDDNQLYIPLETMRVLFNKPEEVSFIDATLKPGQNIDTVADKVHRLLKRARGDEHFQVMTPAQVLKFLSIILGIVQGVLVSIAAISLVVGAVGITNSMYTSVLERTRHIGVMKAIGAKNSDIALLFLIESGFLGLVGGIIGVLLGTGISTLAIAAINALGAVKMAQTLSIGLVLFGVFFSFFLGMAAGLLPAVRASRMQPVDALRYE